MTQENTQNIDTYIIDVGTVTISGGSNYVGYEVTGQLWPDAEIYDTDYGINIALGWSDIEEPESFFGHKHGIEWDAEESRYTVVGEVCWDTDPGEGESADVPYVVYYGKNVRSHI